MIRPVQERSAKLPLYGVMGVLFLMSLGIFGAPIACGPPPQLTEEVALDGGEEAYRCFERGPGKPEIQQLSYFGQEPNNRRLLRIYIDYSDLEADLQGGQYQFWVDGKALPRKDFPSVRDPSAVKGNAILQLDLAGITLEKGQDLQVEVQIMDAQGNASNRALLVMRVVS
ncbi:MAG: hypothetical protein H6727_01390 [Myxococcales bacterium]|nr:hypothetical protein [Myxococcales bacterium]